MIIDILKENAKGPRFHRHCFKMEKLAVGCFVCCCPNHRHRHDGHYERPGKEDPDGGDECVSAGNPKALSAQTHLS